MTKVETRVYVELKNIRLLFEIKIVHINLYYVLKAQRSIFRNYHLAAQIL